MAERSESLVKAQKKWKDRNQIMKSVAFHREHDKDLLDYIERSGRPFGAIVKDGIRELMLLDPEDIEDLEEPED